MPFCMNPDRAIVVMPVCGHEARCAVVEATLDPRHGAPTSLVEVLGVYPELFANDIAAIASRQRDVPVILYQVNSEP
jgi:hypothetical protein